MVGMADQGPPRRGNGVVGVLKEQTNKWERRAPLSPHHCAKLLKSGVKRILVQPCSKRIYQDAIYRDSGCEITNDLSECGLILGVKQPTPETLLPDRSYAFFSHTHKAQPENMPLLDKVLERRITLFDYELIKDSNVRCVYFGQFAGYAGMIDGLRGLGERLLSKGYSTPFLSIGSTYMYTSLSSAKQAVLAVGEELKSSGLPPEICPLVFVFTGTGNVSSGAQEILNLLPHEYVDPSRLHELTGTSSSKVPIKGINFKVFGCVVSAEHMVEPKTSSGPFDKHHYYEHPEEYSSIFAKTIAPHASVIVNCMYWEQRFPRLLTSKELLDLRSTGQNRLLVIADITCDKGGSMEFVRKYSSIHNPFFRYNPEDDSIQNDMEGEGILLMAIDCLPTELPRESTKHFGNALFPYLVSLANARKLEEVPAPLRDACIAHEGSLTEMYKYVQKLREVTPLQTPKLQEIQDINTSPLSTVVSLSGHLFDQHLINEALDVICSGGGRYRLATWELGQSDDETSHADLEVTAESKEALNSIVEKLAKIAVQGSNCRHRKMERSNYGSEEESASKGRYEVLILGAGRMCEPAVKYLTSTELQFRAKRGSPIDNGTSRERVSVAVASLYIEDAQKVVAGVPNASAVQLDTSDVAKLEDCVSKARVVISLLPADLHIPVATACIKFKKHLVTASYVSEAMQALDGKAKEAGVTLLCEMGLDPGIDHLMAMKMIDSAHKRGGRVQAFVSYCGGLPAPEAANNPLGYKFSWNPAGAIKAGRNAAVYLQDGQRIEVPGEKLFSTALPVRLRNTPAFALERLPNRDSLKYGDLYGISKEASTIFRATLRYQGFSKIMDALGELGYFDTENPLLDPNAPTGSAPPTYSVILTALLLQTFHKVDESDEWKKFNADDNNSLAHALATLNCCKNDVSAAENVATCIRWLGLDAVEPVPTSCNSIFEVLCKRMEEKLTFGPDEKDMVLLHHELDVVFDESRERHTATLLAFGESVDSCDSGRPESAMARTVGIPAAIAAELLLFGAVKTRGVLRPLLAEIYEPALEILEAMKLPLVEHVEVL